MQKLLSDQKFSIVLIEVRHPMYFCGIAAGSEEWIQNALVHFDLDSKQHRGFELE